MAALRLAGILFVAIAFVCIGTGTGLYVLGSEAADNVCDDPGIDPCRGRDARALGFRQNGEFLLWGGFLVILLSAAMFVAGARQGPSAKVKTTS